ncbi:hypothetical protein EON64_12655 [archaeon]|nr:MAG: hypothetical protein EON64_12655 [archaeon]
MVYASQRRTGIKNEDIDEFMRKASDIQTAIKGLMDGTLNPEDVKIEGIETDEERQKKEAEQAEKRRLFLEKEEKLRIQRKQQEKERWWSGAEAFKPRQTSESTPLTARQLTEEEEDRRNLMLSRYTADYSRWGQWAPSDEVSRQEEEERQHLEEDLRNQEFERNNPEFCQQFLSDMEQRKKASQQKQESADVLRLKGNRHFKAKDYKRALEIYMEGLKSTPFDAKLLLNIAQVRALYMYCAYKHILCPYLTVCLVLLAGPHQAAGPGGGGGVPGACFVPGAPQRQGAIPQGLRAGRGRAG